MPKKLCSCSEPLKYSIGLNTSWTVLSEVSSFEGNPGRLNLQNLFFWNLPENQTFIIVSFFFYYFFLIVFWILFFLTWEEAKNCVCRNNCKVSHAFQNLNQPINQLINSSVKNSVLLGCQGLTMKLESNHFLQIIAQFELLKFNSIPSI